MITNKIIIEEVDELRHMLLQGKAEVPSFWSCMWPGLVIVSWNILCAMISVNQNYLAVKYIFWVVIFPGGGADTSSWYRKCALFIFFSAKIL